MGKFAIFFLQCNNEIIAWQLSITGYPIKDLRSGGWRQSDEWHRL